MNTAPRRPWIAALLAVLCAGLGHLYAVGLRAAIAVFLLWFALALAIDVALRAGPAATVAAAIAALAFWIGQAVHAAAAARRRALDPRAVSSHPLALLGFYAATTVVSNAVLPPFRTRVAHTVYVPSGSMIPTIQVGDWLAVASGRPRELRGAVVVHGAPPGARTRDSMLRRVVAVGGDTVELRDGALLVNGAEVPRQPVEGGCTYASRPEGGWRRDPCLAFVETLEGRAYGTACTPGLPCGDVERQVVPPGYVWVAGDHRDHSADSRVYGPIPESLVQGEVRWVIASWGPTGPRWSRFGDAIR